MFEYKKKSDLRCIQSTFQRSPVEMDKGKGKGKYVFKRTTSKRKPKEKEVCPPAWTEEEREKFFVDAAEKRVEQSRDRIHGRKKKYAEAKIRREPWGLQFQLAILDQLFFLIFHIFYF